MSPSVAFTDIYCLLGCLWFPAQAMGHLNILYQQRGGGGGGGGGWGWGDGGVQLRVVIEEARQVVVE